MLRRVILVGCVVAGAGACTKKAETPAADSPVNSSPEAGGAAHVDMIRLDTGKSATIPKSPATPAPPRSTRDSVVLRDSASGPKMEIDSRGKVGPIKK